MNKQEQYKEFIQTIVADSLATASKMEIDPIVCLTNIMECIYQDIAEELNKSVQEVKL